MADRYLLEVALPGDGYLLEDGSGVLLLEQQAGAEVFFAALHRVELGMVVQTAAGLGGVLEP